MKVQLKKFPQSFITNISIEYNKYILDLTVSDLYQLFNLSNVNGNIILKFIVNKELMIKMWLILIT